MQGAKTKIFVLSVVANSLSFPLLKWPSLLWLINRLQPRMFSFIYLRQGLVAAATNCLYLRKLGGLLKESASLSRIHQILLSHLMSATNSYSAAAPSVWLQAWKWITSYTKKGLPFSKILNQSFSFCDSIRHLYSF